MKSILKNSVTSVMIASSVMFSITPALADTPVRPSLAESPSYGITNMSQAQVKSVVQEKTATGWTIAAVIKLSNQSGSSLRIPDYELRGKFSDGTEYVLNPSAANKTSIPPLSYVELTYYTRIDANIDFKLTDLEFVHVNWKVYPKTETVLADAPVDTIVWRGNDSEFQELTNWGESFTIPGVTSDLRYTTMDLSKQYTSQSPTYVIRVMVENPSTYTETVPEFTFSGKTGTTNFIGSRIQQGPIILNPGDKKYIDFTITTDSGASLKAFYVMLSESYLPKGYMPEGTAKSLADSYTTPIPFFVGKLGIQPPAEGNNAALAGNLPVYQFGSAIDIDSVSQAINQQTAVSLEDLSWFENDGQNYKTAVAKIKFTNKGDSLIPIPQLGAEIVNDKGVSYTGIQNTSSINDILPGMGTVSIFTFTVPKSEEAGEFAFRLMEQQGKTAIKTAIASLHVNMQTSSPVGNVYAFYPYELTMNSFSISNYATKNAMTSSYDYNYRLNLDLDIHSTDAVAEDQSNPKLLLQLEGSDGKRLSSKTYSVAGSNRLMSGNQKIMFDNANSNQLESPISVKVYEVVSTPYGDARRFLTELKE